ncbi:hypothetical protein EYC84_008965 [Monilinia fructicola]|uniref:Uncharacterized protein n=1 Tax=Monilinia fructicola TaxID=38448 RepID=A0A5M9JAQ2_MONFR|nr:hypothetical protein EYC84_008965 [Monilinia fructicola]
MSQSPYPLKLFLDSNLFATLNETLLIPLEPHTPLAVIPLPLPTLVTYFLFPSYFETQLLLPCSQLLIEKGEENYYITNQPTTATTKTHAQTPSFPSCPYLIKTTSHLFIYHHQNQNIII